MVRTGPEKAGLSEKIPHLPWGIWIFLQKLPTRGKITPNKISLAAIEKNDTISTSQLYK
jgi:hypothetical protein